MKLGQFISFEGSEGVGKTTQIQLLAHSLEKAGIKVLITREPGGTPIAEAIRDVLLNHTEETLHAKAEVLLLYAGRLQHIENCIKPALAQGTWVISDRFFDASYAYQGGGRKLEAGQLDVIHEWSIGGFEPDLTILLDAPLEVSLERLRSRGKALDRIESEQDEFFLRIKEVYLKLAQKNRHRTKIVDANQSLEAVAKAIYLNVSERFKNALCHVD